MLLRLDFSIDTPIYQQIRNQIVRGIAAGDLKPGDQLPPVRTLAEDCGVNMMTVSKAYQLLKQEGYISTDRRGGTTVCGAKSALPLPEELLKALRLHMSELRLAGLSKAEVMELCGKLYEEG